MSTFDGITPTDGDATILAAALAVLRRVERLPEPRSLCEIGVTETDYRWLRDWGRALTPPTVGRWLDWVCASSPVDPEGVLRRYEAFGTLLLFLAAGTARREAQEGQLWPTVRECFRPSTREALFVQGQPMVWHKEALEAAIRRLRLRNVIGVAGTQHYYDTIYYYSSPF